MWEGRPRLINCAFVGNHGGHGGGAITGGDPTLVNCLLIGNSALRGGGIDGGTPTVTNCTFSRNSAQIGGAMNFESGSESLLLTNSVLWGDTPQEISIGDASATVTYSDIQGGWAGEGNIDADPLFVDPDSGDYRLQPCSPCIDAADNYSVPPDTLDLDGDGDTTEPIPFDLDGNSRFVDDPATPDTGNGEPPIVDMGAYEFQVCAGDITGDGDTDQVDLAILLALWGQCESDPDYDPAADLDGDGCINHPDLGILLADWGCGT